MPLRGLNQNESESIMKNGYTPKEFAYSIAVEHLFNIYHDRDGWLDDQEITESDRKKVKEQIAKLHKKLAEVVNLETSDLE
jgi:iron uptake system EfeUOB component EfeO/EfeM